MNNLSTTKLANQHKPGLTQTAKQTLSQSAKVCLSGESPLGFVVTGVGVPDTLTDFHGLTPLLLHHTFGEHKPTDADADDHGPGEWRRWWAHGRGYAKADGEVWGTCYC